jgi:LETM1 and EF-hand domain-containing protein 1
MDVDEDGVINLDHVYKVIELLGTEHVHISAKQIKQIIEMLAKEEMLEVEQKIESILHQTVASHHPNLKQDHPGPEVSQEEPLKQQIEDHSEDEKLPAKSKKTNGGNPSK